MDQSKPAQRLAPIPGSADAAEEARARPGGVERDVGRGAGKGVQVAPPLTAQRPVPSPNASCPMR